MTDYRNEQLLVGTTLVIVSPKKTASNQRRTAIIIVNIGATTLSISVGDEAVNGEGIILYPGGSWEQTANGGYLPPQERITIISSVAGGTASLYEEVM